MRTTEEEAEASAEGEARGSPVDLTREKALSDLAETIFEDVPQRLQSSKLNKAQVDALISSTTARLGRLDVLVNNAGLGGTTPVVDMTDDEWDRVLNVTLTSTMRATRAALRYFREADHGGVIVNNASVLGILSSR